MPSNSWENVSGLIYAPTPQKGTHWEEDCDGHDYSLINCVQLISTMNVCGADAGITERIDAGLEVYGQSERFVRRRRLVFVIVPNLVAVFDLV